MEGHNENVLRHSELQKIFQQRWKLKAPLEKALNIKRNKSKRCYERFEKKSNQILRGSLLITLKRINKK